MKKIILSTALLLSSMLYGGGSYIPAPEPIPTPVVSSSPSQFYAGLGLAAVSTYGKKLNWFKAQSGQDRTGAIVGILGYQFTPNIAVEGRLSYGSITGDFSNNLNASIFLKPSYNITNEIALYGLLGFGWVKIDGTNGHADIAKSVSPQLGLGASYKIQDNVDIFADYTWLLHDKKSKSLMPDGSKKVSHEAFTLGVNYHF